MCVPLHKTNESLMGMNLNRGMRIGKLNPNSNKEDAENCSNGQPNGQLIKLNTKRHGREENGSSSNVKDLFC